MTTQPWLVTGWSTGSGSTLGKPISVSHRVTRTEVASRVTESGDVTRAIARHSVRRGKVVDGGGEQADQPRVAGIEPASSRRRSCRADGRHRAKDQPLVRPRAAGASSPAGQRPRGTGGAERGELPFQLAGGARTAVGGDAQQLAAGLQVLVQAADAPLRVEREHAAQRFGGILQVVCS